MPILHCQDLSIAVSINTVVTTATPFSLQVKSGYGSSNCTACRNLIELANKCHNVVRLPTLSEEAYDETLALLSGECGPPREGCRWLKRNLTPEQRARIGNFYCS